AAPSGRAARRLAAQRGARDADAELEPDQVARLVHRGVLAGRIGHDAVLLEAAPDVLALRGERDINAPAKVAEHRTTVALEARDHLDLSRMVEAAARGGRAQHAREVVHAA